MARYFSLPSVLRQVPNQLLHRFFNQLPYPSYCIDWGRLRERQADALVSVVSLWPPEAQEFVEGMLRNVFDLACELGYQAIRESARVLNRGELLQRIGEAGSLYAKAMWTWLEAPDVFELALTYHQIEDLSRWRRRDDLPATQPRTDPYVIGCLATEISRILMRTEGRGQQCTVEHFQRENGTDYFCCYPDDFLRTVLLHDEEGALASRSVRQTFEIVFAYQRDAGILELAAPMPTKIKQQLEESFAWMILDEQIGPHAPREVYDLNRLKDRNFRLETDPADEILARCRRLRLDLKHQQRRIILESQTSDGHDVFRMAEECLDANHVAWDDLCVTQATIQFVFRNTPTRRRGSMTIDVSAPNRCNLRSYAPERAAIGRKYLRMWRITDV